MPVAKTVAPEYGRACGAVGCAGGVWGCAHTCSKEACSSESSVCASVSCCCASSSSAFLAYSTAQHGTACCIITVRCAANAKHPTQLCFLGLQHSTAQHGTSLASVRMADANATLSLVLLSWPGQHNMAQHGTTGHSTGQGKLLVPCYMFWLVHPATVLQHSISGSRTGQRAQGKLLAPRSCAAVLASPGCFAYHSSQNFKHACHHRHMSFLGLLVGSVPGGQPTVVPLVEAVAPLLESCSQSNR
jgi:hypothetical protein